MHLRSLAAAAGRPRATWWVAFSAFWLLLAVWSVTIPRLGGPDEPAHVVKAAGVAHGDLGTSVVDQESAFGTTPITRVRAPNGYGRLFQEQTLCWSGKVGVSTACAEPLPTRNTTMGVLATYVGTYQPAYYAFVGLPTRWLPPHRALIAARLLSAGLVAALLASAYVSASSSGGWLARLGVLMAATPTFAFLGGVINPSGPEIAAAVCLWASLLLLVAQPAAPRRVVARVGASVVVLALARPLGPAFAFGVVAATLALAADRAALRTLVGRRSVRWIGAGVAVIVAASVAHVVATDALGSVITNEPLATGMAAAEDALRSTPDDLQDQIGLVSWVGRNELRAPGPFVVGWLLAAGALLVGALVLAGWRQRLVLAAIAASVIVLPVLAQVSTPEVVWQGRYVLPILAGVPVLAGWAIDRTGRLPARAGQALLVGGAVAMALGSFLTLQLMMSRNLYGFPNVIFTALDDARWDGPGSPAGLRLAAIAGALGLVAVALVSLDRWWRGEEGREPPAPAGRGPATH